MLNGEWSGKVGDKADYEEESGGGYVKVVITGVEGEEDNRIYKVKGEDDQEV